ncbi:MAG: hypothetical protein AAF433_14100 [Bacteroidota bacterium]
MRLSKRAYSQGELLRVLTRWTNRYAEFGQRGPGPAEVQNENNQTAH